MKIGVVGLGYIGSVTAGVLAEAGNEVIGVEIDQKRLDAFKSGEPPIYEPGLKELFGNNKSRLVFSSDYKELTDVEVVFLAVPTPTENGKINLDYVFQAAESVKAVNGRAILVIKSTVVPGTAKKINAKMDMIVVSNPEFTKEGTAVDDTRAPDRVVIGGSDQKALSSVERIWAFTKAPVLKTTNENAEMVKYASNSFLATKISFINEIANLCEKIPGCDVETVAKGMGFDKRISPYFLKAGIGYGGSCFPKDTSALQAFSREIGSPVTIVEAAIEVNSERTQRIVDLLKSEFKEPFSGHTVGVFGLTFKGDTDDTRGSQALKLVEALKSVGFKINVYDPMAKITPERTKRYKTKEECADDSDAIVVATDWGEFKTLSVKDKLVIDAKRILDPTKFNKFKAIGLYG